MCLPRRIRDAAVTIQAATRGMLSRNIVHTARVGGPFASACLIWICC
jgi:hypothetical protein